MSHFPPPIRTPLYWCFPFLIEKGEIFTWGNGSNGKLGHGDGDTRYKYTFDALILIRSLSRFIQLLVTFSTNSRFQPTQISECFDGKRVLSVSCGYTHTACTAAIRPTGSFVKKCMGCKKKFSIIQVINLKLRVIYNKL